MHVLLTWSRKDRGLKKEKKSKDNKWLIKVRERQNIVKEVLQHWMKNCRALHSQPSTTAKGTGRQLSLQKLSDLHGPSKISIMVKGNGKSHPVTHPSSHCQKQSRHERPPVFVFMTVGTECLVDSVILGSLTHLRGLRSVFYERQENFQRHPRWQEQRAEVWKAT